MTDRKITICFIAYMVIGFWTFGVGYNACIDGQWTKCHNSTWETDKALSGAAWPIYWTGRAAIWVTKW